MCVVAPHKAVPTSGSGFLDRLSSGERAALRLLGRQVRIPAGATFALQGQHVEGVFVLDTGHAKLTRTSASGHETLLGIRDPGDIIGQELIAEAACVSATATALTDIDALVIARSALLAHLDRTPRVLFALLETVSDDCADLVSRAADRAGRDTLARLADCLTELAERYGEPHENGTVIALPIRQDDLAAWTCASRAGTTKALQTLRELGWIRTQRAQIIIDDVRALRQRAA